MATRFSNTLFPDNSTDANFRAWATFIENTLVTTGGWVVTSDTGQTAPGSLTHPTLTNTKQGYRIYRMNDSLQSTYPVFLRIDFGSGANPTTPSVWFTIGTGSDGAGNITGVLLSAQQLQAANSSSSLANNSYGSADTNRFTLALFIQTTGSNYPIILSLERSKDSSGNDTSDGLLFAFWVNTGSSATVVGSKYILTTVGVQPSTESGWSYVLTSRNPSETFSPGDIGVGVLIHFKGVAQQPGTNIMMVNSSDVGAEGNFQMTLYGSTRTYQHLNTIVTPIKTAAGSTGFQDGSARVCIRYD